MERKERFARIVLNGFESYFADFQNITLAARTRFENADWHGVQRGSRDRIDLYKTKIGAVLDYVKLVAGDQLENLDFWRQAKPVYAELIRGHNNFEIAETFFNSVFCKVLDHAEIRDDYAFVFSPQGDMPPSDMSKVLRRYPVKEGFRAAFTKLLDDYRFNVPWEDRDRDVGFIVDMIDEVLVPPRIDLDAGPLRLEVLEHHFFRNKSAYIVGRIFAGEEQMPFALPVRHNERGAVYVDTVLFGADRVSVIFSFTRSYFMVDASIPSQYVLFLKQLMPAKPISEVYSAIGHYKHGKTVYHRTAVRHMQNTSDQFSIAPGIKGMVMLVFTMPSYEYVFKVIKDRFTAPKEVTREEVMHKYQLVKRWDRAGRMADTQEFRKLVFARDQFSDELMEELYREAPSQIEERGRALILNHVYVERRMDPLNLYLQHATDEQVDDVMDEYGNAIKQLAAANIFPGDMLLKNFGVTRHGRVVFYDYDEIMPLTECNFRRIPEPRTEEEEMSGQPWYSVGPNDVFPEEFRLFFSGNQRARKAFDARHSDLYDVEFWWRLQRQINDGVITTFYPYRRRLSFPRKKTQLKRAG
jgi:isocitrate dehydrogenase kinase/phosphatase